MVDGGLRSRRRLRQRLLGMAAHEALFSRRGFAARDRGARWRLEYVGLTFIHGYMAALGADSMDSLARILDYTVIEQRGFAYEGAATALALLDHVQPWRRNRLVTFVRGPARQHIYRVYMGAGGALARLRLGHGAYWRKLDPLLRWLATDGYGFHYGYFHWQRSIEAGERPRRLRGYARRGFDQGLGRSLWFVRGGDMERIAQTIAGFEPTRRADLWSGVGLAAAYAGGATTVELETLRRLPHRYRLCVAQGAAFAADARRHAGNPAGHTDLACRILCHMSANKAARITEHVRQDLASNGGSYEQWRRRVRAHLHAEIR